MSHMPPANLAQIRKSPDVEIQKLCTVLFLAQRRLRHGYGSGTE